MGEKRLQEYCIRQGVIPSYGKKYDTLRICTLICVKQSLEINFSANKTISRPLVSVVGGCAQQFLGAVAALRDPVAAFDFTAMVFKGSFPAMKASISCAAFCHAGRIGP